MDILDIISDIKQQEIQVPSEPTNTNIYPDVPLPMKLYTKKSYNQILRAKIILFMHCFVGYKEYRNMEDKKKINLALKIEKACYNYSINKCREKNETPHWRGDFFVGLYNSTCYRVAVNIDLDGTKGSNFGFLVLQHKINISEIPKLTSIEMYPQKHKTILDRIEIGKQVKKTVKYTKMYVCGKCKNNKCTYESIQNRSLDECNSIRVTCIVCGFKFPG